MVIRFLPRKKVGCSPREGEFISKPHPKEEIPAGKSQTKTHWYQYFIPKLPL
jgi:hypothetical protein